MPTSVTLGLSNTVDYEIYWDTNKIQRLVNHYQINESELLRSPGIISEERSLVVSLLYHMKSSGGGEHFVANLDELLKFANHFEYAVTLGGTGLRAAISMAKLGQSSTVHLVSINDQIRELIPANVTCINSAKKDLVYPHVIVQYPTKTTIQLADSILTTNHPNRIIYLNDPTNSQLLLSDQLDEQLKHTQIFLISGLNAMKEQAKLRNKLTELRHKISLLPVNSIVYYEDAGFHHEEHREIISREIEDLITIHSMNEDEAQFYLGYEINLLDANNLIKLAQHLSAQFQDTAVIVHSKYWALATGKLVPGIRQALRTGITMASTKFLYGENYSSKEFANTKDLPRHILADELSTNPELIKHNIILEPGLELDTIRPNTVGLGDSFTGGMIMSLAESNKISGS